MNKETKTLGQVFSRYIPKNDKQRDILSRSLSLKTRIDKEKRFVETEVSAPELIKKSDLWALCEDIRMMYELNSLKIITKYAKELFTTDYIPEILKEASIRGAVTHGFFCEYEITLEDGRITIQIGTTNGGIDLVCASEAPKIISDIIYEEFSLRYIVNIIRDENYSDEAYFAERDRLLAEESARCLAEAMQARAEAEKQAANAPQGGQYGQYRGFRSKDDNRPDKAQMLADIHQKVTTLNENDVLHEKIAEGVYATGNSVFDTNDATLIYGEEFDPEPVLMRDIKGEMKNACVMGEVFGFDTRQTRNKDKTIISFFITDEDSSFTVKCVLPTEGSEAITGNIKNGAVVAVYGSIKVDRFDAELAITPSAIKKIKKRARKDKCEQKRVELHIHTQMSMLDATIPPDVLVNTAHSWGHKAVALTDHGNVQGFPIAMTACEKLNKKLKADGKEPFKVIYGMEAYFVDDTSSILYGTTEETLDGEFVVFDIETTGKNPVNCKITEIGAVTICDGEIKSRFNTFADPECHIPEFITELTGITDDMVKGAPKQDEAVRMFLEYAAGKVLIAHNAAFDTSFIKRVCSVYSIPFPNAYIDTLPLSRYVNTDLHKHTLDRIAKYFHLEDFNHHRACDDAEMLAQIYFKMAQKLKQEGVSSITELSEAAASSGTAYKQRPYHMIILVKNKVGLKNLYRLISYSYLKYFYRYPLIPKTVLNEHREGLIISSACCAGELYKAILEGKGDDEISEIAEYYDYFEIQPLSNNSFMLNKDSGVSSIDELIEINKKIIEIGRTHGKPVCATTDAHVLNKEDEIGRKIILAGKKMKDSDSDSGLYFRTTDEMMDEFYYLDDETKQEVIIDNPNKIADMTEIVRPIPEGNFPPKIDGADEELTQMCYDTMHSMYGENPPEFVEKRLKRELDSIIKNGFGVLYIIAQKLVKNSNDKGYLVGSRGSVGSSFVATMANITEVNPLPPHYRCLKCKYSDFDVGENVGSGFDLPDKYCPVCGAKMYGDGHDIPFETFLGFDGDKSPDIDLNFSGDVQADAHKYTEVLFGEENVFRAGTLGTLADKTAYGLYVMKYIEEKGITMTKSEIQHLVNKCVGVKRTTGQHPGGIIVVPRENEVYDFTPVQHPADDPKSDIVTTHFAFEYLHDTILKLDILGHDVPTKYKMLEKYTNTSVLDAPMNDRKVYDLLLTTEPLGIRPDEINSQVGTFGLPELGTKFVRQMLIDTKPQNFSDLLQISGLSHGTDVWLGNAQNLIKEGTCTISEVIGTRDNIMVYLLHKGLEPKMAFTIMEIVRKGNRPPKNLKQEHFDAMRAHGVPEWYIESCLKIKYMFPKAHAAAYIISAIRLGWYKVYYPMQFYAAYFTAAPDGLDATVVLKGEEALRELIKEIENKPDTSQKDAEQHTASQLALEAICRGVEFLPVDLKRSDAKAFLPEDGKIRLPFSSLPNLGETAAENLAAACKENEIYSIEELARYAKLSKTVIEILRQNGVLDSLSETNQLSMF